MGFLLLTFYFETFSISPLPRHELVWKSDG